ncbi:MAG: aspartate ammonia-lyase [Chlorobi bacterium]|nr:aspartate ammonia-lyase [Chlorobiota bacterium]
MDKAKIKTFFQAVNLFEGLSSEDLDGLIDQLVYRKYKKGEFLFEENSRRENIFIIHEGEVELFKTLPSGTEKKLVFFGAGDFLGEGSLEGDSLHSTSARAIEPSGVFILGRDYFLQEGEASVKIFSNIIRVISRRMRYSNNRLLNSAAQYESGKTRKEHDLLGFRDVPYEYYFGVQTLRAMENFNISGVTLTFFPVLIESLAMVKLAAAEANFELGLLEDKVYKAIIRACKEIINGKYHQHFVVDMIQGGAGTSTNMNANEVIANRALEIMGYPKGDYSHCHPNNHVNLSQSTNDVYPTAVKLALIFNNQRLIIILEELMQAFRDKAYTFSKIIKMGRTQLQDAVPMTLGQEFEAYAVTLEEEIKRLNVNADLFLEINMGGTAIGTGINTDPEYSKLVLKYLRRVTGLDVSMAKNLVEATQDTGSFVMYSSAIKRLAIKLSKISNDLRLLSSGPRAGLNEINLPAMQPGSSIMPGKVNPVIPEVVNQVAFKVIGNDLTVSLAAEAGQLELNVMEPVIVQSIFESVEMLKNGMRILRTRCIEGITANESRCRELVENSIGIVTALNPVLGYEVCSSLAKEALETNRGVYELVLEKNLLTKEALDDILSPEHMVKPYKISKR